MATPRRDPPPLKPRRVYTADERIEAVARVLAGASQMAVARATGVDRTSLGRWMAEQRALMAGRTHAALSRNARAEPLVAVAEGAARRGFTLIHKRFDDAEDATIPYHDRPRLRDIAYATDVAHTAHLDYRDGRKGAEVHVDARSVTLQPLAHLSLDELRSLASGGPMPAALVAPASPSLQEAPLPTPSDSLRLPPTPQVDRKEDRSVGPPNRRSAADQRDSTGDTKEVAADLSLDTLQALGEGARDGGRSEAAIAKRAAKRESRSSQMRSPRK